MDIYEIFDRQFERVYMTAMIYMKNKADSEDIAQTVFLKYLKSNVKFRDEVHEKAWFIRVTRNCCKDALRTFWRKNVDIGEVPERCEIQTDTTLQNMILTLPEKYREVLYMHYYEGYSAKEIGKILGRNASTVRTQLATGRDKLKTILTEEGFRYD